MTRSIQVSTEVFAAIWAERKDGEESETEILERLFNCRTKDTFQLLTVDEGDQVIVDGYYDNRNDVHFREGFCVFRNYKGSLYQAEATRGQWRRMDNGMMFTSLNKLNESIVAGNENIWNGNWQYLDEDGDRLPIDRLRS